jgi:hypothetical protein
MKGSAEPIAWMNFKLSSEKLVWLCNETPVLYAEAAWGCFQLVEIRPRVFELPDMGCIASSKQG